MRELLSGYCFFNSQMHSVFNLQYATKFFANLLKLEYCRDIALQRFGNWSTSDMEYMVGNGDANVNPRRFHQFMKPAPACSVELMWMRTKRICLDRLCKDDEQLR